MFKVKPRDPKYRGRKKGMAEVWIGESRGNDPYENRLRIRSAYGVWNYWDGIDARRNYMKNGSNLPPCWLSYFNPEAKPIQRMRAYDKVNKRKTIFLGYVPDEDQK